MARQLNVPALSLVVLIGTTGSGKSTLARKHFSVTEVLSSDVCRGLGADDENDQAATPDAFDVLHYIAGKRLAAKRLTVVDATNVQPEARRALVELARAHDVLPAAIVLDVPESLCLERNALRPDRQFGPAVVRRQRDQLRRGLRGLEGEGFRTVHILRSPEEVQGAEVVRTRLFNDLRHEAGPFDVIGDVHGCRAELEELLTELGYVLRLVMGMVAAGEAFCVPGNHENKLLRALRGKSVRISHGLAESLEQLEAETPEFRAEAQKFLDGLVSHYVLDGGQLVVCHAGLVERMHGRASGRVRSFCLYGQTTGETDEFGLPVRYPWAEEYRGRAMVLYGHTPVPAAEWVNNTLCLDTGCVLGGRLTALRYPERQVVAVPAARVYYEPAKPFPANPQAAALAPAPTVGRRESDVLDLTDVTEPFRRRPPLAALPAADDEPGGDLAAPRPARAPGRGVRLLPGRGRRRGGVRGEAHGFAGRAARLPGRRCRAARFGAPGGASGAIWTRTGRVRRARRDLAAARRRAPAVERQGRGAAARAVRRRRRGRPHAWHLDLTDRLVAADPGVLASTRRVCADTTDPASTEAATAWWTELVTAGGEGMVVKPAANLVRAAKGLVQPGLKVRGPEYLRIIYGPDYAEPANLDRLRSRGLGHKRSLALREYALGEPLWRVHECVFAVLALESEPVDPRL